MRISAVPQTPAERITLQRARGTEPSLSCTPVARMPDASVTIWTPLSGEIVSCGALLSTRSPHIDDLCKPEVIPPNTARAVDEEPDATLA
eukprot:6202462-Pleurochrysis_carterae.AAC.1